MGSRYNSRKVTQAENNMKIAFLNIYNGKIERGSEVFVQNLAMGLCKKHEITVFQTGKTKGIPYKAVQIHGIPFLPILNRRQEELYHLIVLYFTLKCLPYLWREKFNWIIPINGRWQVLIIRLYRFLRGGKVLISGHAGVGFEDRWNILAGKPDIFVALTPAALSWARNIYPEQKIVYIPNGIDTDKFNPKANPTELPLPRPIILSVAALLPYKRLELLIKAVSKLEKGSLMIIGDGPLRRQITSLGDNLLKGRFQLIPHVAHEEMPGYYKGADLFSLPSRESEAFGLVYLEAMACNLPVVAPDDVNRREIIGEAGILGDLENTGNYAKLLSDALKTDFGDKPHKQAEKFSWKLITSKYEKIFDED